MKQRVNDHKETDKCKSLQYQELWNIQMNAMGSDSVANSTSFIYYSEYLVFLKFYNSYIINSIIKVIST